VNIKAYATQDEANMDLKSGRIELVIADSVVLLGGFEKKCCLGRLLFPKDQPPDFGAAPGW
jgi:ABC-type amino acid transport substrate-binding protein